MIVTEKFQVPAEATELRASSFNALADDVMQVRFLAEATSFMAEKLLIDHLNGNEPVSMSADYARMLDFMVSETRYRARAMEERYDEAHGDACEIEKGAFLAPKAVDPLLALVHEYRDGNAKVNAADTSGFSQAQTDALLDTTWGPAWKRLCEDPPNATTFEGAIEAIRLVHDEEANTGHKEDFTINVLAAALAFFGKDTAR